MDRWYIVFDEEPHGNRDMPLYFLWKLYAEFILGKHVNYFDILEFQGIGQGMHHNREHSRADPNRVHPPNRPRNPPTPPIYILPHLVSLIIPKMHFFIYLKHFFDTTHILRAMELPLHPGQRHLLVDMLDGSHLTPHRILIQRILQSHTYAHHVVACAMDPHLSIPLRDSTAM